MIRILTVLILLGVCAITRAANDDNSQLNKRIQTKLLIEQHVEPAEGVKRLLREGKNIQVLVNIPGAGEVGGPLLDPNSVKVEWNQRELKKLVYYTTPKTGIVMALFPQQEISAGNTGELQISASILNSPTADAGWRLPISFTADDATSLSLAMAANSGRRIQILDEKGEGIPGAFLFGQRRSDVFTQADDRGSVLLDAMARNSSAPHLAWTPEHWTAGFDPITTQTVTLTRKDPAKDRVVEFAIRGPGGIAINDAVLLIDETNSYFHYHAGDSTKIIAPPRACQVLVIVAGYPPKRVWVSPADRAMEIQMNGAPASTPDPVGTPLLQPQ